MMKTARMPSSFVLAAISLAVGCSLEDTQHWSWSRPAPPLTSAPIVTPPDVAMPEDADTAEDGEPLDDSVASLAQRIQVYAGRFPQDDLHRKAAPPTDVPADATGDLPAEPAGSTAQPPEAPDQAAPSEAQAAPTLTIPPMALARAAVDEQPTPAPATGTVVNAAVAASPSPVEIGTNTVEPGNRLPRIELLDVRPVTTAPADAVGQPFTGAANQPVLGPDHAASAASLSALIEQLEQEVSLHPRQLDDQFRLRLLYMATGQDDKAAGPIDGSDPVQSELLSALFRLLTATRHTLQAPNPSIPSALAEAEELRRLIAQQSPVQILKLALVTRVNSFGDYRAVTPPRFPAGQPVHVFLYTEITNFRSEPTDDNRLRTLLAEKVEVFDSDGSLIWQRSEPHIEDLTLSPRRDFFMAMEIQLPDTLAAGEYVLKVTVEDKLGATMDQRRMNLFLDSN
jgi:hypothetical protein